MADAGDDTPRSSDVLAPLSVTVAAAPQNVTSKRQSRLAKRGSVSLRMLHHESGPDAAARSVASGILELKERTERAVQAFVGDSSDCFWVLDDELGYTVGKAAPGGADIGPESALSAETLNLSTLEVHAARAVPRRQVGPRIHAAAQLLDEYDDMAAMEGMNEPRILQNLTRRLVADKVYTSIGSVLLAVNPFRWVPGLYSVEQIALYNGFQVGGKAAAPPSHIFAVAAAAYRGMREQRTAQAILISGESGAGKTEATKKCLQFFAEVAGGGGGGGGDKGGGGGGGGGGDKGKCKGKGGADIAALVLASNPLLEAFGNAQTVRNKVSVIL
jgi:hypothetical protein